MKCKDFDFFSNRQKRQLPKIKHWNFCSCDGGVIWLNYRVQICKSCGDMWKNKTKYRAKKI